MSIKDAINDHREKIAEIEERALYEFKTGGYESPIAVYTQRLMYDIMQKQEDYILEQVHNCGVTINKDELVKALAYDRNQYNKGFEAGRAWVNAKIYSAYKALQDGFAGTAQEYLEELLDNHKEATDE